MPALARRAEGLISADGPFVFSRCYESLLKPTAGFLLATVRNESSSKSSVDEAIRSANFPGPAQVSTYRMLIGSRPGADYLLGSGPVTIFATNLTPGIDAGVEAAWNYYYDNQHFSTVLTFEGYVAGTRLTLENELDDSLGDPDRRYVVIYELVDETVLETWHEERMPKPNREEYARWLREGEPHTRDPLWLWGRPIP
jgi:hypothetical protein